MGPPRQRLAWAHCAVVLAGLSVQTAESYSPIQGSGIAACTGYDLEWAVCKAKTSCTDNDPIDCKFSDWTDWVSDVKCTGLKHRIRDIDIAHNNLGRPCEGARTETDIDEIPAHCSHILGFKPHEAEDCEWTEWGEWSSCKKHQRIRRRQASRPRFGGAPCAGPMMEIKACQTEHPVPCNFTDWHDWVSCSVTCGEGHHTRARRISHMASKRGEACKGAVLESHVCFEEACPAQDCILTDWSSWTHCHKTGHPQRYRTRSVLNSAAGKGDRCQSVLTETSSRDAKKEQEPACVFSDWLEWSKCTRNCSGGQRQRRRFLNGSTSKTICPSGSLQEIGPCDLAPCNNKIKNCEFSQWQEWTECLGHCNSIGSKSRSREVEQPSEGGLGCEGALNQVAKCLIGKDKCVQRDCVWGVWQEWSACGCSCGGGVKHRNRYVISAPRDGGELCTALNKSESVPCNTHPCAGDCQDAKWSQWSPWSSCPETCDHAVQYRKRFIEHHASPCGKVVKGRKTEHRTCNVTAKSCNADCKLGEWENWGSCTCTCFGTRERNRNIRTVQTGKGASCKGSLAEVQPCNTQDSNPACKREDQPEDCELADWSDWTNCTRLCGGGQQTRARKIAKFEKNGGISCKGSLKQTKECNTNHHCNANRTCQDCILGEWSTWSDCVTSHRSRYRDRAIWQMPNFCGKPCTPSAVKEAEACSPGTSLYSCGWSDWTNASSCGVNSMSSFRSRNAMIAKASNKSDLSVSNPALCWGSQLKVQACSKSTGTEKSVDCKWADWDDWSLGVSCDGLCQRTRLEATLNNDHGKPCTGAYVETKPCDVPVDCVEPKKDCELSDWTSWEECTDINAQRSRSRRIVSTPRQGGIPCDTDLEETAPCESQAHVTIVPDCVLLDWTPWVGCSLTCGTGYTTRSRGLDRHDGGKPCGHHNLKEIRTCIVAPCEAHHLDCQFGDWNVWSECGEDSRSPGLQSRTRQVQTYADGGVSCDGPLEETRTCGANAVDCEVSEWTSWSPCADGCEGQQLRHRQINRYSKNWGKPCPVELMQTQGCLQQCGHSDCEVGDWSDWEACSSTCGLTHRSRHREVLHNRDPAGDGCNQTLSQMEPCPENPPCEDDAVCRWTPWSDWKNCSVSCGGGQTTRSRTAKATGFASGCQAQIADEIRPCSTQPCPTLGCEDGEFDEWSSWSPCSATCRGGITFRKRRIAKMANYCGQPPTGPIREQQFCHANVPCISPVDCKLSDWHSWSHCNRECDGFRMRKRHVERFANHEGRLCGGILLQAEPCNVVTEESGPRGCQMLKAGIDCLLDNWADWSACSAKCDGGQTSRARRILQQPELGGRPCSGPLEEVQGCATQSCTNRQKPVDCVVGDWEDWSNCLTCGGSRSRFRHVERYPLYGGRNCDTFDAEERGNCPHDCHKSGLYCTWANWMDWSQCSATCGEGKISRRRYLEVSSKARAPPQELLQRYSELQDQSQELEAPQRSVLLVAFAVGCASSLVLISCMRLVKLRRFAQSSQDHLYPGDWSDSAEMQPDIPPPARNGYRPLFHL